MRKSIHYLIAAALTLAVAVTTHIEQVRAGTQNANAARPSAAVEIHEDGEYTIGGVCNFNVKYKQPNLSNQAAVDIPAEESRQVTFSYPDNLYLAGCHLVHFLDNQYQQEMTNEQGDWEVCFGNRPDEKLTIYYYSDELSKNGQAVWYALPTVEKDTYVCAPAMYSGVYAPGGIFIPETGGEDVVTTLLQPTIQAGTVQLTVPNAEKITEPGTYGAGGICELTVDYYVPDLSNELHVEENVEVSAKVPFPDNKGLLYLPGYHVYHYKTEKLVDEVTTDEGSWEICFAAIPGKETTIFFYYAEDDISRVTSVWSPLDTRVEGGKACATVTNYTGVYTPVGK